jgi:hypothetical protein
MKPRVVEGGDVMQPSDTFNWNPPTYHLQLHAGGRIRLKHARNMRGRNDERKTSTIFLCWKDF